MKKLSLTVVAAAAMFFSVQTSNAQVTGEEQTPVEQQAEAQQEWQQIENKDLPAEVKGALERDFQGATIAEAYVTDKDGEQKFKLVVTTADGATKELYADAQGNWIENK